MNYSMIHFFQNKNYDYLICMSFIFHKVENKKERIINFLKQTISFPKKIDQLESLFFLYTNFFNDLDFQSFDFLEIVLENKILGSEEFEELLKLYSKTDKKELVLNNITSEAVHLYLSDQVGQIANEIDLSTAVQYFQYDDGDSDFIVDKSLVLENIYSELISLLA